MNYTKTNEAGYVRETSSNAIINNNTRQLDAYKIQRSHAVNLICVMNKVEIMAEEIFALRLQLTELKQEK